MITRRHLLRSAGRLGVFGFSVLSLDALRLPIPAYADEPIRIATLASGTVSWELETIVHYGLDRAHGFTLAVMPVASKQAADIMLAGGEADMIVTDWLWVSRQRHAGQDYKFLPYSRQVGAVLVKPVSDVKSIADLKGRKIGVAGGPTDKGWTLVRSFAMSQAGLDLTKDAEPVFAAPPLLSELFQRGSIDALITYWHLAAALKAQGAQELISLADVARTLGLDPDVPLLGYVFSERWSLTHDRAAEKFYAAAQDAKKRLAEDDEPWIHLRPLMNAKSDHDFELLKAGYREGIPKTRDINEAALRNVFAVLAHEGGDDFTGQNATLAAGLFLTP